MAGMPEISNTSWPKVLVLIGAGVAVALQVGKVPVALPYLQADLDMSLVQSGWVVSIFGLVAAIGAAFLGMTADRLGQMRMAIAGLVLTACASFAGGLVTTGNALLVTRVAEGFGFLLTATSIPPLVYRVSSERHRRTALALWSLFLPTGSFLMMTLSGPILAGFDWRVLWMATSALVLCAAVPVLLIGRTIPQVQHQATAPGLKGALRTVWRPAPMIAALAFGLYAAQYFILAGFLPLILITLDGFSPVSAAIMGAGFILMNVFGNLGSGWLHGRGLRSSSLIMSGAAAVALLSLVVFNTGFPVELRIAGALLFGAFAGLIPSSLFAMIPMLAGRASAISVMSGVLTQGSALGQLSGPPLAAAGVAALGGWGTATPIMLMLAICTALCGWALARME